jgi:hypothetical protein
LQASQKQQWWPTLPQVMSSPQFPPLQVVIRVLLSHLLAPSMQWHTPVAGSHCSPGFPLQSVKFAHVPEAVQDCEMVPLQRCVPTTQVPSQDPETQVCTSGVQSVVSTHAVPVPLHVWATFPVHRVAPGWHV